MRCWALVFATLTAVLSSPALACRAPPDESEVIKEGRFKTVALARVTRAEALPIRPGFEEYEKFNWSGAAQIARTLRGKTKLRHAKIRNMAGPGSCRFIEMPKVGDLWVVYIRSGEIAFELPVADARRVDPTLSKLIRFPQDLRAASEPSSFPKSLTVEGEQYDRLTGVALRKALHGKTVCPSVSCNEIAGGVRVFRENGMYLAFGDRWEGEGSYVIVNDLVVTQLDDDIRRQAFYRSKDGALLEAWERGGKIVPSRVFTK